MKAGDLYRVTQYSCESESHSVVSNSFWPHGLYSPWNSPGWNTAVGSLSLLKGIFPTQGLNPGIPHCRWILYQLSHKESPRILEWVAYPFSSRSSQSRDWTRVSCISGRFFANWAIRGYKYSSKELINNPLFPSSNSLNLWMWSELENKGLGRCSQGSQGELILDLGWAWRPNIGVCVHERQRFET